MSLHTLVNIAESGPWCGTRPPGRPRPQPHLRTRSEQVFGPLPDPWRFLGPQSDVSRLGPVPDPWRLGPSPEPWRLGIIEVGLYGAITLHQLGRLVTGPSAEALTTAAEILFEDHCGTIPLSELIWILLHRPPPPPPQWLNVLTFAGETLAFAQATQQEALATAASRQIAANLKTFDLQERSRASQ